MLKEITDNIKGKGAELGFSLIGISPVGDYPESQYYKSWLNKGYEAGMGYMSNNPHKRKDVRNILPGAKTVISCAMNYNTNHPYSTSLENKEKGWISRYAWGDDYHIILKDRLEELKKYLIENTDADSNTRVYVDTGPVLERMYAKYSGIGWIGKNTCLINQDIGSWLLIGELITDIELEYDSPAAERCGTCRECIDKCPTEAIVEEYVIDSSKCISYLNIENKDVIPIEYREQMENNIFGCDICQDVCPWNSRAGINNEDEFKPRDGLYAPDLLGLVSLDQERFSEIFRNSPVKRSKRKGLLRNVLVAIGNSGNNEYEEAVIDLLRDSEPLVRRHAVWALHKISGLKHRETFIEMISGEGDEGVKEELKLVLADI